MKFKLLLLSLTTLLMLTFFTACTSAESLENQDKLDNKDDTKVEEPIEQEDKPIITTNLLDKVETLDDITYSVSSEWEIKSDGVSLLYSLGDENSADIIISAGLKVDTFLSLWEIDKTDDDEITKFLIDFVPRLFPDYELEISNSRVNNTPAIIGNFTDGTEFDICMFMASDTIYTVILGQPDEIDDTSRAIFTDVINSIEF